MTAVFLDLAGTNVEHGSLARICNLLQMINRRLPQRQHTGRMMGMTKKPSLNLTDQLRAAVAQSGMTLGELSRTTGIAKSALSRFVNGERGVSMEAMDAIGRMPRIADRGRQAQAERRIVHGEYHARIQRATHHSVHRRRRQAEVSPAGQDSTASCGEYQSASRTLGYRCRNRHSPGTRNRRMGRGSRARTARKAGSRGPDFHAAVRLPGRVHRQVYRKPGRRETGDQGSLAARKDWA